MKSVFIFIIALQCMPSFAVAKDSLSSIHTLEMKRSLSSLHEKSKKKVIKKASLHGSKRLSKKMTKKGSLNPKEGQLGTSFAFDAASVRGKYQMAGQGIAAVEDEKVLDDLLGLRKSFKDRDQQEQKRW